MSDLVQAMAPLFSKQIVAAAGTSLFHRGDPVVHLYSVQSGCVHLQRVTESGATAVMQRASPGALVAESSIFSSHYHCDGIVVADARLVRADVEQVRRAIGADPKLHEALSRHLAGEVQRTRGRVEILSLRTVQERLDAWLAFNGDRLPPRGSWRSVAEDIGVSPEAFYRELQRRRMSAPRHHSHSIVPGGFEV